MAFSIKAVVEGLESDAASSTDRFVEGRVAVTGKGSDLIAGASLLATVNAPAGHNSRNSARLDAFDTYPATQMIGQRIAATRTRKIRVSRSRLRPGARSRLSAARPSRWPAHRARGAESA
jgi:hypothetical protein